MDNKSKLLVFASGSAQGGGSGFENLVNASREGVLEAEIVGVVSNHEHGGVREKADRLGIPFYLVPPRPSKEDYIRVAEESGADFFALSGWLKFVVGLDPRRTFNIHPGPLPEFGGKGMYGHHVHQAVMEAYKRGEVTHSAVTMHFIDGGDEYDKGPVILFQPVKIEEDDTPDSLGKRVNEWEHRLQPVVTNLVVTGKISWDGEHADSLVVPDDYETHREEV